MQQRVTCLHGERCGGCPLLDRTYPEQLAYKGQRVHAAFAAYAPSDAVRRLELIAPVAPAHPIVAYRTRAKLMVGPHGELGLFAKDSAHVVVDTPGCRVLAPAVAATAAYLRAQIAAALERGADPSQRASGIHPFDPSRPTEGGLRAVDLREVSDGEASRVLVTLVVASETVGTLPALRAAAKEILQDVPCVAGVAVNFHDGDSPQVLGRETLPVAGEASVSDRIGRSFHTATFGSFAQAHRGQAEAIHALLADALGLHAPRAASSHSEGPLRVLEVYGGSGAIGLGLAAAGARVQLVESFEPAAAQAALSARAQGLDLVATCEDAGAALRALGSRGESFDAVVLNPPRRGTSPETREGLARLGPARIAYVSCDPDTLARDLVHLERLGYHAEWVRPFDMIPLTDHVECVALLRRGEPTAPRILWEGVDAFAVDKAAHEPTAPHAESMSSLLERVRALPGGAHAVPLHRLDAGTSGAVLFARDPEKAPVWQRAVAAPTTRRTALVAVRGTTPLEGRLGAARASTRTSTPKGQGDRYRRVATAAGHSLLHVALGDVTAPFAERAPRRGLAAIGHPVLGDDRFGHRPTNRHFEEKYALDRGFVHVVELAFEDPTSGQRVRVESPVPGDLRLVSDRMGVPQATLAKAPRA